MSTETGTLENQVPLEVAELWAQLHAEATRRRDDLKPVTSRRSLAAVSAVAIVLIALVSVGYVFALQRNQGNTEATVTAAAIAAVTTRAADLATSEARETQVAITATADWYALQTRQAEDADVTATAAASATTATAIAAAQATKTAQATATVEAMLTATAIACLQDNLFAAKVDSTPTLQPAPSYKWVTDKSIGFIGASWTVTNTGQCAWEQVTLTRISGPTTYDYEISSNMIPPGSPTELTIQFTDAPQNPVNASWVIVANEKPLLGRGGEVFLQVDTWIIAETPTPTPTRTPTATPTPSLGDLTAREPKSQRYMSEGVIFEWTYDTELENVYRFQILARSPSDTEILLPVPESCSDYSPLESTHRCIVRDGGRLLDDGRYIWSVRVIDGASQVLRQSNTLSFDLSRQPVPTDTPVPDPTTPPPPGTRTP